MTLGIFICFLLLWWWVDHGMRIIVHNQKEIVRFLEETKKNKE